MKSICFTDLYTGYIVCATGEIFKTFDYGANWSYQNPNSSGPLYDVYFPSDNIGYAVGRTNTNNLGKILKTEDSGGPVGINQSTVNKLSVYPNPVNESLTINATFNPSQNRDIYIYSITGQEKMRVLNVGQKISVASLQPGLYIIQIISEDGRIYSGKFIKE